MTLLPTINLLNEGDARKITTSIQLLLDSAKSTLDRLEDKVVEAYERRADLALGYASWGEYADAEFSDKARYLPRSERREFTIKLSDRGMPSRAVAPIVGVNDSRVRQITREVGSDYPPTEPDQFDRDVAEAEAATRPPVAHPITGEVLDDSVVTETHTVKVVTGLDGKEYKRPEPAAPRRNSLIESARNAGWQLRRAAESLERIQEDDRFTKNKAEILAALQPHLDFVNETISGLGITTNTNEEK